EGWLCDKGRFAYPQLYAADRVKDPLRRTGRRRFEELSWAAALDQAEALLRLVRQGLSSDAVVLPEQTSPAVDAFRAPLSSIRDAARVIVAGDDPVEERAPV